MAYLLPEPIPYSKNTQILCKVPVPYSGERLMLWMPTLTTGWEHTLQMRYSGYLQHLRCDVYINSLERAPEPKVDDELQDRQIIEVLKDLEWNSKRYELLLQLRTQETDWVTIRRYSLLNRWPGYTIPMLDAITDTGDFLLGDNAFLSAIIIDVNWGLPTKDDEIIIYGGVKEEAWYYQNLEVLPTIIIEPPRSNTVVNIRGLTIQGVNTTSGFVEDVNTLFGYAHRMNPETSTL